MMILKSANQLRCDLYKAKEIISLSLLKHSKQQSKPQTMMRMMQIGKNIKNSYESSLIQRNLYSYRTQQKFIDFNKDYYEILGIGQKAQFQQIKQKYYHLAKQCHPDRNKGNQSKFKEITQAYNVLSQQKLRKEYDEKRSTYFDDDDLDEKQNNLKNEQPSSSLNYGAYSQMSRAQWAVYRSGKMNHSTTDYTNYDRVYTPETGIDVEYKKHLQWERAFKSITEQNLREQVQFRQKLYKKHREDIQKQSKAKQEYIDKRVKQIGDKIQRLLGKSIRSIYDKMIAK